MTRLDDGLYTALLRRGVSRRSFIKFSAAMAAALALPASYAPRIARAVATAPRLPVVWLRGQDCAGNTTAFLHASEPTVSELVLDLLSVDYHETLMAPAGDAAALSLAGTMEQHPGGYLAIVEGAIPLAAGGVYCTVGGRAFSDIVREVCSGAIATIAVGSCAFDGGSPAARGGPTGAVGVAQLVPDAQLVNLPGCPLNVENLTATIVHYLTFSEFPLTDARRRPFFAYGGLIHNQCERRAHFEFGEFVLSWGDEGAQKGWCLYKVGCKGPETFANCPTERYAAGTSWPVKAGHGCVGCTMPGFWDAMSPFYWRLPAPVPLAPTVTVDQVGQALVGGVAVVTVAHGAASYVRSRRIRAAERRAVLAAETAVAAGDQVDAVLPADAVAQPEAAAEANGPPGVADDHRAGEPPSPGADDAPTSEVG
jgi:hydrogenase small subunit